MKLFGVVGGTNAETVALLDRLVPEICGRGHSVSAVKQAHDIFDVDRPGKDSYRHRTAGATEVLLSSRKRFALMHELRGAEELSLEALLSKLKPVDLVLVEGYARDSHPKIEVFCSNAGRQLMAEEDPTIQAVASDMPLDIDRPVFDLNDTKAVSDFILREVGLT